VPSFAAQAKYSEVVFARIPLGDNKRNLWQRSFSKGASSPGLARTPACFVKVCKVFARPQARKNLTHFHMSAPQARRKQSYSDL